MKTLKKHIITIGTSLILLASQAFSVDFGGSLNNNTKFSTPTLPEDSFFDDFSLKQQDSLNAWLRIPFNNSGTHYLVAQVSGMWQYDIPSLDENDGDSTWIFDLDLLKYSNFIPLSSGSLQINAGRFFVSDTTSIIFSQVADGLNLSYSGNVFDISVYGAYTGLLNAQNVTILNASDSEYSFDSDKVYDFAAPYIVSSLTLELPYLFANQSLVLEGYGFFGVSGPNDGTSGYKRAYGTVSLNGPLAASVFYTLSTTIGSEDFDGISNLSKLALNYYPNFYSASIGLEGIYASGENGPFDYFKGFSSQTALASFSEPQYSGLIKTGLNASIKPIQTLFLGLGANIAMLDAEDSFEYYGFEWNLSSKFQVLSDLQLSLLANQFIGDKSEENKASLTFKASISF